MVSLEVVGMECLFVEGYMMKGEDWVGLVKCSEGQMIFE